MPQPRTKATNFENVFLATYSGVPVWEYIVNSVSVMRRKDDSWLNATQLLKVANVEKARRTKILEREWATDALHEKVQGGYGKYQGTWIPFERGILLCQQYKISHMVAPLLDFDPQTMTALPKPSNHAARAVDRDSSTSTTASTDTATRRHLARYTRNEAANRNHLAKLTTNILMEPSPPPLLSPPPTASNNSFLFTGTNHSKQPTTPQVSQYSPADAVSSHPESTPSNPIGTTSAQRNDGDSSVDVSPCVTNRKSTNRNEPVPYPQYSFYHSYPDEMLSVPSNKLPHFNIPGSDLVNGIAVSPISAQFDLAAAYATTTSTPLLMSVNTLPSTQSLHHSIHDGPTAYRNQWMAVFLAGSDTQAATLCGLADKSDVSRPMDSEGNTPMHWATALGRVHILQVLVSHGANPVAQNKAGETPLMRAVCTSHNADAKSFLAVLHACATTSEAVCMVDHLGQSVLHHLVRSVNEKIPGGCALSCALYYMHTLIDYLMASLDPHSLAQIAHITNTNGLRAIDLASRHSELVSALLRLDAEMVVRHPPCNTSFLGTRVCAAAAAGGGGRFVTIASPLVSSGVDSAMMVPTPVVADRSAGLSE